MAHCGCSTGIDSKLQLSRADLYDQGHHQRSRWSERAIDADRRATATVTDNSSGVYSFTGLSNGNYTVTPSKYGYIHSLQSVDNYKILERPKAQFAAS